MVYYFEIVSKPLTAERLPQEVCPVCQKKGDIEVTLYMRYISMLIPIFGMGRATGVHCTNCGHEIKAPKEPLFAKKNLSPEIKIAIQNIKATHRRTLWQLLYPWSLILLLACLIGFGVVSTMFRNKTKVTTQTYLSHPQVGDMYKASLDSMFLNANNSMESASQKTLLKLVRITGDTMVMLRNKQVVTGYGFEESNWSNLSRKDDAFGPVEYKISLEHFTDPVQPGRLWKYYDKTAIDSITRNKKTSAIIESDMAKPIGKLCSDNSGRLKVIERN